MLLYNKPILHLQTLLMLFFEGSILDKANFINAINFTIDPTTNSLKKAKFHKDGLIGLLKKYDIVVQS